MGGACLQAIRYLEGMKILSLPSFLGAPETMRRGLRTMLAISCVAVVSTCCLLAAAPKAADRAEDPAWHKDLAEWRAKRAQGLSAPDGWLTLVGLDWLKPGNNSVGLAA